MEITDSRPDPDLPMALLPSNHAGFWLAGCLALLPQFAVDGETEAAGVVEASAPRDEESDGDETLSAPDASTKDD